MIRVEWMRGTEIMTDLFLNVSVGSTGVLICYDRFENPVTTIRTWIKYEEIEEREGEKQ